jgi:hypothetical protein
MRQGKLLIEDEILLENNKLHEDKGFYIPSSQIELAYILWKAAAKGKPIETIEARAKELFPHENEFCDQDIMAELVELLGIVGHHVDLRSVLKELLSKYKKLPLLTRIGQIKRFMHRVRYPSGCYCIIKNGKGSEEFAETIKSKVTHSFRKCDITESFRWKDYFRVARSTLLLGSTKTGLFMHSINRVLQCEYLLGSTDAIEEVKKLNRVLEQRTASQWGLSN